ncbi:MAG: tetratricopeptide repeat protein [Tepidisphaeraceae bacterium]
MTQAAQPTAAPPPVVRNLSLPLGAAGLLLICILAFAATFRNGFIWDDDHHVTENIQLLSLQGLHNIWLTFTSEPQYYPLTHTTFWIEYHLWKANPLGYHIDNVLLHAIGAIVLWRILVRIKIPGAYWVAMIWAVHPLQLESVAWVTERKNVLSGLLYFLALWTYLKSEDNRAHQGWYLTSLVLFLAALFSKTVVSSLPVVILLIFWWQRGKVTWDDVMPLAPMFAAGFVLGCLTSWMERHVVGAVGPAFDFTILDRICIAGHAVWFYLWKILWPVRLIFIYPRWDIDPVPRPWQLVYPAAVIACLLALWLLRHRLGRGPIAAALFFVITLFPALGFVNVFPMRYSFVADHFQYLAGIGPIILIVALIAKIFPRDLMTGLLCVTVAGFCVIDLLQSRVYFDSETLWADVLSKDPNSMIGHNDLGIALFNDGKIDEAEAHFRQALSMAHSDPYTPQLWIGQCEEARGNHSDAIEDYHQALLDLPDSSEPVLHMIRAEPYYKMGVSYAAWAHQTAATDPTWARYYLHASIDAYETCISINPTHELAMTNLAAVFTDAGLEDEAIAWCRKALAINPESVPAHINWGNALVFQNLPDDALLQYQAALAIAPDNVQAINNIGQVYASEGKYDQAISQFRQALQIDPSNDLARHNLESALLKNANK